MGHHVIYVPGLHDRRLVNLIGARLIALSWRLFGFKGHVVAPRWEDGRPLDEKVGRIVAKIDSLVDRGHLVSLFGQSAGASAVMLAFAQRSDSVVAVVNNSGRLRVAGTPSLNEAAKGSPAFAEAVRRCQAVLPKFSRRQLQKIATLRPRYDAVVPPSSVRVEGATNAVLPLVGHGVGGGCIATLCSRVWLSFCERAAKR